MKFYRSEIDGLRAISVIAVILFHLNPNLLIGGYYGVDVFFVISGYLITDILIKNVENKSFKITHFWLRRVKRLIPLLLVVVIVTSLFLPFLIFKPILNEVYKDITPAIFSWFNFHALFNYTDYWGQTAEKSFFLHTWSLSVEEQFYLIYPLIISLIYKFSKNFLTPLLLITTISFTGFLIYVRIEYPPDQPHLA